MKTQIEREEEALERDLDNGVIDHKEYNRQMRELQQDYRESARESAQEAYDREMERW
jgi:hypothetical protein